MASPLVLVTGSTDGIGRETAHALAAAGARVVVHGRDPGRVDSVAALLAPTGALAGAVVADLGQLSDVDRLAEEADRLGVDVLVNNAGVYQRERQETADGHEATWGVNHLAPFLLTHRMLAGLRAREGRVVNVSSVAHFRGRIDLDDPEFVQRPYNHYRAYATSKLANLLVTRELGRRIGPTATPTVNALHPGVVGTKLLRTGFEMDGEDSLADGAATSVRLAVDPSLASVTGRYFAHQVQTDPASSALDDAAAAALYDFTCRQLGIDGLPPQA